MFKNIPMLLSVVEVVFFYVCASIHSCSSEGRTNLPEIVSVPALIAFGDSFVDQGNNNYNAAAARKANHPPYGKDFVGGIATGRFSNGKTIPDFFAEGLGVKEYLPAYLDPLLQDNDLLTGVSFGSGGTGYDPLTLKVSSATSLPDQLLWFKQYTRNLRRRVGEEAVVNIMINGVFLVCASTNDIIISLPNRSLEHDVPAYDSILVNSTLSFVQELYKLGARRIAVFSTPPIGCFPEERTLFGGVLRMCVQKQNEAAKLYNSMLKEQLPSLTNSLPQSRIAFVDFYNPLKSVIDAPQQYGLEVADRGCCGTETPEMISICNRLSPTCSNDSKYFFWDSIHLSEIGCEIFVNQTLPSVVENLF